MNIRKLIGVFAATAALAVGVLAEPIKVGASFPDLAGFSLEGPLPQSLKGKVLLIDFWASWCAPCKASFPALQKLSEEFASQGLVVLGVSVDEKKGDMERFLAKAKVTLPVVRDASHKLVATAGIETMPSSILVDAEGKVRFVHKGFHGETSVKEYRSEIKELLQPAK